MPAVSLLVYDGAGNRIEKKFIRNDSTFLTHYLRDASGNIMAVYNDSSLIEQPIYGSSRLGQYLGHTTTGNRTLGHKNYELTNHLGNVLTVVTDNISISTIDTIRATVASASDYYPFGLQMPGRTVNDTVGYRYGFNGKERDESFGSNHYDFGARIYSPEIGRWLSVDPLHKDYPFASPYNYTLNNPIKFTDPDGRYVKGEKTTSLTSFLEVLKQWEIEAVKHRQNSSMMSVGGPVTIEESENHVKLRIFDTDFRATDQIVNEVGGQKGFSYTKSFGKYLNVGLPLDVAHFMKMANLAQDYPEAAVRWRYVKEEFKQSKDKRASGRSSAFAPEDLFSNELGVIFGSELKDNNNFSEEFEVFMNEVNALFTTNTLGNGKYLDASNIKRLRNIAQKYYGTDDLTNFQKDSNIYSLDNIKIINNNAFFENFPFFNNEKNSSDPPDDQLIDYSEKSLSN